MYLRLKKRKVFLDEILLFLSQTGTEIEFVSLPLPEILRKIISGNCCENLDFIPLCLDNMQSGDDFFCSWKNALEFSRLPMKKEERDKLKNLGTMLGKSDIHGQVALLSLNKKYFSAFYNKAVEDMEKYGKMCLALSTALGIGIFILIA